MICIALCLPPYRVLISDSNKSLLEKANQQDIFQMLKLSHQLSILLVANVLHLNSWVLLVEFAELHSAGTEL